VTDKSLVSPARVRTLAELAGLPLASGRETVIAPTLGAWLKDANDLARKMSAAQYRAITPATIFHHPRTR
jgi:hypothetical protein